MEGVLALVERSCVPLRRGLPVVVVHALVGQAAHADRAVVFLERGVAGGEQGVVGGGVECRSRAAAAAAAAAAGRDRGSRRLQGGRHSCGPV